MSARYPLFVKRDLDGFFGLAVDNLVQLLLIVELCAVFCGMTGENAQFITRLILPGAAVSLLIGNVFYAMQAHWVARREMRSDITALPYGINTPSLLVYVFFVLKPAFERTGSAEYAWRLGLIACLGSGVIEFTGAFLAERLRRNTPRAALLSTLAGIAIAFIAMMFALQIWQRPLVAMVPLAVVMLTYFAQARFPLGLPGGLIAVLAGTLLAWLLTGLTDVVPASWSGVVMSAPAVSEAWASRGWFLPQWVWPAIQETLTQDWKTVISLLSVIIPMGLFNVIGSLQNIESAEAGGDVFATGPSLAVNGMGTIAAALFGSCFPTTIYIGHPGWKALGARAGYSTLNGLVLSLICITGTVSLISRIVPLEAGIAIVLWIGVVITAQAFQASPIRHAPAVAIGLFPAIAAWGATIVAGAFDLSQVHGNSPAAPAAAIIATPSSDGSLTATQPVNDAPPAEAGLIRRATLQDVLQSSGPAGGLDSKANGFLIHGMNILERGYIFTCMIAAAIAAFLIDRRFRHAAGWCLGACVLTVAGLMHAYQLRGNVVDYLLIGTAPEPDAFAYRAYPIALGYLLMAVLFLLMGRREHKSAGREANTLEDARTFTGGDQA
jgi:AGZA family xanthine/uracil permease-like MFS transporter